MGVGDIQRSRERIDRNRDPITRLKATNQEYTEYTVQIMEREARRQKHMLRIVRSEVIKKA